MRAVVAVERFFRCARALIADVWWSFVKSCFGLPLGAARENETTFDFQNLHFMRSGWQSIGAARSCVVRACVCIPRATIDRISQFFTQGLEYRCFARSNFTI